MLALVRLLIQPAIYPDIRLARPAYMRLLHGLDEEGRRGKGVERRKGERKWGSVGG